MVFSTTLGAARGAKAAAEAGNSCRGMMVGVAIYDMIEFGYRRRHIERFRSL